MLQYLRTCRSSVYSTSWRVYSTSWTHTAHIQMTLNAWTCTVVLQWQTEMVVPLYSKGNQRLGSNYRLKSTSWYWRRASGCWLKIRSRSFGLNHGVLTDLLCRTTKGLRLKSVSDTKDMFNHLQLCECLFYFSLVVTEKRTHYFSQ